MAGEMYNTTTTTLNTTVSNFKVSPKIIDEAGANDETTWINDKFSEYLGYYKTIPELKKAIDALAMWTTGKGWVANSLDTVYLEHIRGWGEDSFQDICRNMIVMKKVNGDAFAEIIRDEKTGILINLKPLNPGSIRTVVNKKGLIIRYEEVGANGVKTKFKPEEILHLCNDRVANEIHGTSVIEACKWIIDARNEAMADWRRILHRSTIRVMYVDIANTTRLTQLKTEYATAINKGELMIIPAKPGEAEFEELNVPPIDAFMTWIRYLEQNFYKAVGVSETILGGTENATEATSKVAMLNFEQPYMTEQMELETDIWNQLYIKVKFDRPVSLKDEMMASEQANTGQVGIQPNETQTGVTRTE